MTQLALAPAASSRPQSVVAFLGIGAASPATLTQAQFAEHAAQINCQTDEQKSWLARVYLNSGIKTRGAVLVDANGRNAESFADFYPLPRSIDDRGPTTAQRMARYAIEAPPLASSAAAKALIDADIPADAITHLITVSCTGFVAPGLDVSLINSLELSPSVRRQHIGFMGCHGAFNALAAARDAVLADANAKVLVCCVELCSLHFAYGWDPGKLVANALFADGAAAVVLGASTLIAQGSWEIHDTASCLLPDSLDAMTWRIGDHGFEMTLLPGVPKIVRQHLRPWCEDWLARHELAITDIRHWAIHPGGPKILASVADALSLPEAALQDSRDILSRHGNMSSATVLFILQQLARQNSAGPCVAIGLGPGLMAEGMLLKRAIA